jgi:adenosylhomocysteine nucleosidase
MTTAILSALPEEQAGLLQQLQHARRHVHGGRVFWQGLLSDRPVVLALSGMGKVAAATTATVLIERFACARVLFTGVAGGLGQQVRVGDVVVARQYLQHDMDASPLCPRWELPGYGRADVACDPALSVLLLQAAQDFLLVTSQENQPDSAAAAQAHHGLVVSGDRFIATAQASNTLRRELQEAGHTVLAVEMEGAAVAQVCADYQVPFAAMRTISDRADDDAHVDFTRFIETVASRYAEHIVQRWLQAVPH